MARVTQKYLERIAVRSFSKAAVAAREGSCKDAYHHYVNGNRRYGMLLENIRGRSSPRRAGDAFMAAKRELRKGCRITRRKR